MRPSRRDVLKLATVAVSGLIPSLAWSDDVVGTPTPPRMPLDVFVQDKQLMDALRRGVRAMKARKPSDPLSWFYQAAIHGVTADMIQVAAAGDPNVITVDQKKYWNQCPHFGQPSANFLPWHRGYTYYFERILRAHTNEPRFALPFWDYSKPANYRFPREFGIPELDEPLDGNKENPLFYENRNAYFTAWTHWSGDNLPYSELTPEAVDWSPARDAPTFFGYSERDGIGGAVRDEDPSTRGRLESFPHDPIHRLTGIIVPAQVIPDPNHVGQVIEQKGYSLGMSGPPTAGFDPIFCVHHSNIDRLWATWSLMSDKQWGPMPPKAWFEDNPWTFFDVQLKDGKLVPVEVSRPRMDYFDSRKLGITFEGEDLARQPLTLPDPLPDGSPPEGMLAVVANIPGPVRLAGVRPERLSMAPAATALMAPFTRVKHAAVAGKPPRVFMRLNDVDLGTTNATGFDIHLVASAGGQHKRTDPSFVGSIALFRHDQHAGGAGHADHPAANAPAGAPKRPSDTFDITRALQAAAQPDPTKMHVVVVPYSLSRSTDVGNGKVVELRSLQFGSVDFLVRAEQ